MINLQELLNLKSHILDHVDVLIGRKLLNYVYHDQCSEDQLISNGKDIDIISQQLELIFENIDPKYISWAAIKNWASYSLCLSDTSFSVEAEQFTKTDNNWKNILNKKLLNYEVYGYKNNKVETFESGSHLKTEVYLEEPHLLILEFENKVRLGLGNFYGTEDFVPVYPNGDDIWIIFGEENIESFKSILKLDLLITK